MSPERSGPAKRAAFFDVDNTVIRGASIFALAVGLKQRGIISNRDILRYSIQQLKYQIVGETERTIADVRRRALSIVAGRTAAEISAIGEEVYDTVIHGRIWPGTQALLSRHLELGDEVWLVTATPREVASVIAERLGVTGAIGTLAETVDGVYTGALEGDLMHGKAKGVAVARLAEARGFDLEDCFAYGDSSNDIYMLQTVGHPTAINPDRKLRRHATAKGWSILDFRNRRMALGRGVRAASLTGGGWLAYKVLRSLLSR
ncbi:HAD family hydrolase [Micrococcales bacterium 31B]|nr:HAD family hydrolase [Micrococcales bacterium 31B]